MTIQEAMKQGSIVDVREPYEFQMQHAEGAVNIPLGQVMSRVDEFARMKKPVLLYCQSGNRSGQAEMLLRSAGLEDVYNIGGIFEVIQLQRSIKVS